MITDLPGIYSLSPYTLEEVVARNYLLNERPDAILNIVDGTNLERNLYLTTQLTELGIPVVVAVNMIDVVHKNGDRLNVEALSAAIGCPVVEISALKGTGISAAAEAAIKAAQSGSTLPQHSFSGPVEHALAHIEEVTVHDLPEEQQRWYAIKLFERDEKVSTQLQLSDSVKDHIEKDIQAVEKSWTMTPKASSPTNAMSISLRLSKAVTKEKHPKAVHIRQNRPGGHQPLCGASDFRGCYVFGLLHIRFHRRHVCNRLGKRRRVRRRLAFVRHRLFRL